MTWERIYVYGTPELEFEINPHPRSVLSSSVWLYFQWMIRWINKAITTNLQDNRNVSGSKLGSMGRQFGRHVGNDCDYNKKTIQVCWTITEYIYWKQYQRTWKGCEQYMYFQILCRDIIIIIISVELIITNYTLVIDSMIVSRDKRFYEWTSLIVSRDKRFYEWKSMIVSRDKRLPEWTSCLITWQKISWIKVHDRFTWWKIYERKSMIVSRDNRFYEWKTMIVSR